MRWREGDRFRSSKLSGPASRAGGREHSLAVGGSHEFALLVAVARAPRRLDSSVKSIFPMLMRGVEDHVIPNPGPYAWDSGVPVVIDVDHFLWAPPLP